MDWQVNSKRPCTRSTTRKLREAAQKSSTAARKETPAPPSKSKTSTTSKTKKETKPKQTRKPSKSRDSKTTRNTSRSSRSKVKTEPDDTHRYERPKRSSRSRVSKTQPDKRESDDEWSASDSSEEPSLKVKKDVQDVRDKRTTSSSRDRRQRQKEKVEPSHKPKRETESARGKRTSSRHKDTREHHKENVPRKEVEDVREKRSSGSYKEPRRYQKENVAPPHKPKKEVEEVREKRTTSSHKDARNYQKEIVPPLKIKKGDNNIQGWCTINDHLDPIQHREKVESPIIPKIEPEKNKVTQIDPLIFKRTSPKKTIEEDDMVSEDSSEFNIAVDNIKQKRNDIGMYIKYGNIPREIKMDPEDEIYQKQLEAALKKVNRIRKRLRNKGKNNELVEEKSKYDEIDNVDIPEIDHRVKNKVRRIYKIKCEDTIVKIKREPDSENDDMEYKKSKGKIKTEPDSDCEIVEEIKGDQVLSETDFNKIKVKIEAGVDIEKDNVGPFTLKEIGKQFESNLKKVLALQQKNLKFVKVDKKAQKRRKKAIMKIESNFKTYIGSYRTYERANNKILKIDEEINIVDDIKIKKEEISDDDCASKSQNNEPELLTKLTLKKSATTDWQIIPNVAATESEKEQSPLTLRINIKQEKSPDITEESLEANQPVPVETLIKTEKDDDDVIENVEINEDFKLTIPIKIPIVKIEKPETFLNEAPVQIKTEKQDDEVEKQPITCLNKGEIKPVTYLEMIETIKNSDQSFKKHSGKGIRKPPKPKRDRVLIEVTNYPHTLSMQEQRYYLQLTESIFSFSDQARGKSLRTLATDYTIRFLTPQLCVFIKETIELNLVTGDLMFLLHAIRMVNSLIVNPHVDLLPHMHILMPSILTCHLSKQMNKYTQDNHWILRIFSSYIAAYTALAYTTPLNRLKERVIDTYIKAIRDLNKSWATVFGAVKGLAYMGEQILKDHLVPQIPFLSTRLHMVLENKQNSLLDRQNVHDARYVKDVIVRIMSSLLHHNIALNESSATYIKQYGYLGRAIFMNVKILDKIKPGGAPAEIPQGNPLKNNIGCSISFLQVCYAYDDNAFFQMF